MAENKKLSIIAFSIGLEAGEDLLEDIKQSLT